MKEEENAARRPGFQRLRASQYDELRRQLASGGATIPSKQVECCQGPSGSVMLSGAIRVCDAVRGHQGLLYTYILVKTLSRQ